MKGLLFKGKPNGRQAHGSRSTHVLAERLRVLTGWVCSLTRCWFWLWWGFFSGKERVGTRFCKTNRKQLLPSPSSIFRRPFNFHCLGTLLQWGMNNSLLPWHWWRNLLLRNGPQQGACETEYIRKKNREKKNGCFHQGSLKDAFCPIETWLFPRK